MRKIVLAGLALLGAAGPAWAESTDSYANCLMRAVCAYDDRVSGADVIGAAVADACETAWVAAMVARGSSAGAASTHGMDYHLRTAITIVLMTRVDKWKSCAARVLPQRRPEVRPPTRF